MVQLAIESRFIGNITLSVVNHFSWFSLGSDLNTVVSVFNIRVFLSFIALPQMVNTSTPCHLTSKMYLMGNSVVMAVEDRWADNDADVSLL